MKSLKIMMSAVLAFIITFAYNANAATISLESNATTMTQDDDASKDKKEKKDKKKKKKDKKVKSPEEVIALISALEWNKPPKSGLPVDQYYNDADVFFSTIKHVGDSVSLFKVCKIVSPSGESTIAPVDIKTGQVRYKNEAFAQVMESVSFGINVAALSTVLATGAVTHALQIGEDAIPLVGNPDRKKANVQIAKAVKVFPLLKNLIDSQRNMMKRYFSDEANEQTGENIEEAMATTDADFLETLEMSDEELNAYIEADKAS